MIAPPRKAPRVGTVLLLALLLLGPPPARSDQEGEPDAGGNKTSMNDVVTALKQTGEDHGPDSVALQAKLLTRSTSAGALGPVEVRVVGPSQRLGAEYLEIVVDSGLFFDEAAATRDGRADLIWETLAGPVLEEMTSFDLKPGGLELVFLYQVQDLSGSATGKLDPSSPAHGEALAVALDQKLLAALARDEVTGVALRGAVRFDSLPPRP